MYTWWIKDSVYFELCAESRSCVHLLTFQFYTRSAGVGVTSRLRTFGWMELERVSVRLYEYAYTVI